MSLESDSVLSWHDLNLWIPPLQRNNSNKGFPLSWWKPKTQSHLVLNNVSGYAKFGSLLAIMGPSGSGKTTLLATISKRTSDGVTGHILLNGKQIPKDLMLRISGFMPQKDLAVETLTVEEHIEFMAILKSDIRITPIQRKNVEKALLNDLGLTHCKKTLLQNLSGGERRRLALAVQMIIDPPILFCDEPTTGLDSFSAGTVISVLKRLASQGKAVICSIHQPSSDVFMLFDQLCLLLPGGHLAYHGDMEGAKSHFRSIVYQFPKSYNPADFILQILNPSSVSESQKLIDAFNRSIAKVELNKELETASTMVDDNDVDLFYGVESRFQRYYLIKHASTQIQLRLLVWRAAISMYRNIQQIILRSLLYIFTGLLVSTPYMGVRLDQEGIQNLQGFHYAVITETVFCHAYNIIQTFPAEIPILLREIGNGIYKPGPYYFSKVLIILPRAVIETLIFCTVCFCVTGGASNFLLFSAPVIASAVTSSAYGCFISAMFKNISTASLFTVPVDFLTYAFCGLFIQLQTVPMYLRWVKYISRFYYGIEAISILQWQEIDSIPCSEKENMPCITSGEGVLEKYGFSQSNLSLDFFAMLIGFIILHLFGFLSLKYRSRQQSVY